MLVRGVGTTGRAGASVARPVGAGVRVTGRGWVREERSRLEVGNKMPDLRIMTPNLRGVGLVKLKLILPDLQSRQDRGGCSVVSTLRTTLESKVIGLNLICRFDVQPSS